MPERDSLNAAAVALSRFLASPQGRATLVKNAYAAETPFLPANESEPVQSVLERVINSGGHVVVAVHFPDRTGDDTLELMSLNHAPSGQASDDAEIVVTTTTIGMMIDEAAGRGVSDRALADLARVSAGVFSLA